MNDIQNSPLLSMVIPTKNRYEYLTETLISLAPLKKKYGDLIEIVVQDNSDDNGEFTNFLESIPYNVNYYYTSTHLSVTENCDAAIINSNGEFVCFNGDDDSVTDNIVEVVKWMKDNDIDSCLGTIIRYNWPDLIREVPHLNSVSIPEFRRINNEIDLNAELYKVLDAGAISLYNLPKVYHGIVSRKALNKVYERTGSFFPGPSPDMANAIALALVERHHAVIDMPFIISGFSKKSTGGLGAKHAHKARIEDRPNLPKETAANWDHRNPRYWTSQTIWAEAALKSLQRMKREDLVAKFNFPALYASFTVFNPELFDRCKPFLTIESFLPFSANLLKVIVNRGKIYLKNQLERKFKLSKRTVYHNINSFSDIQKLVADYIEKKKIDLPSLN